MVRMYINDYIGLAAVGRSAIIAQCRFSHSVHFTADEVGIKKLPMSEEGVVAAPTESSSGGHRILRILHEYCLEVETFAVTWNEWHHFWQPTTLWRTRKCLSC